MIESARLALVTPEGTSLRFAVHSKQADWHLDSGPDVTDPNPMTALLGAAAACTAMDVISILRKKRLVVTRYEVDIEGVRRDAHPKRYESMTMVHRFRGVNLPADAVADAIRLSDERYCSVLATIRPTVAVTSRFEIENEGAA